MKRVTKIENEKNQSKTRVAAYCRVSTESDEQLVSLEAQKQHYKTYIKKNPDWVFVGVYYDEGITGTKKDKRAGLLKMIGDCEQGKIDFIITKSISRFARNTTDCLELVRKLAGLGIYLYFEREKINTRDMEGELMLTILSSFAEEESVSISQNMKWSVQRRFKNGTYIIANPPYGYRNEKGSMVIVEDEAEIVRQIFGDYLAGNSTAAIAEDLKKRGVKTRRGGEWRARTVNVILRNEKYTGDVIFQKTWTDDSFVKHINKGDADQYMVRDHHAPIISREDFELVQEVMERRFAEKGGVLGTDKYSRRYVLSGKIICGECGGKFKRKTSKSAISWTCTRHVQDIDSCHMQPIPQTTLQNLFTTMMNKLAFGKDVVLVPLLNDLRSSNNSAGIDRINELEEKIEENVKQRGRLKTMLTQGLLDADIFNEENNKLLTQCAAMERELADLRAGINSVLRSIEEVEKLIRILDAGEMKTDYDEELVIQFLDHIVVFPNSVEFVLKCGLRLKEER